MINKVFDTAAGVVFLILGAFFITAGRGITTSSYGSQVGPNAFPTGLGVILALLSCILIWQSLTRKGPGKAKSEHDYRKFGLLLAATILYIAVFEPLGYVFATFLYLVFVFQLLERKRLMKSVLISAVFSGVVYAVYVVALQGNLPPFPEFLVNLAG